MLRRFRNEKVEPVDVLIDKLMQEVERTRLDSEEFSTLMGHLERLQELKTKSRQGSVSPDTVAVVIGNLLGILIIVGYEQKHVLTSKGLNLLIQPKPNKM